MIPRQNLLPLLPWLLACSLLPAQTWNESGDAGNSLATAQPVLTWSYFSLIAGTVQGDVDIYQLQVDDPSTFIASSGGVNVSLFLFDEQGHGITACEDTNGGTTIATLNGAELPGAGRYYLAVAAAGMRPTTPIGSMWLAGPGSPAAAGQGRREAMSGWTGVSPINGPYTVAINALGVTRELVLPAEHHLSENPAVLGSAGTTNYWPANGGRFQLVYDASSLQAAGVNGAILINRLRFRGEDGEVNLGGVSWAGTQVRVAATSLTAATMGTSFATNLDQATTDYPTTVYSTVTTMPSSGGTPNSFNLSKQFALSVPWDPNSARPNLLIEVLLPNAASIPVGATVMAMQDATGANLPCRGIVAASVAATTGTYAQPLVLGIDYAPAIGTTVPAQLVPQPARNERYGAASGGDPASFFETFLPGQPFDVDSVVLLPDSAVAPTHYTVTNLLSAFDGSKVNAVPDSVGDDAVVIRPLGFTFHYPGGSTTSIGACTNGYIWLDGVTNTADYTPSVADLLGAAGSFPARLAPCWYDFHCGRNTGIANSGLHVRTVTTAGPGHAVCYITWKNVGVFNQVAQSGTCVFDMQCVIYEDSGNVVFRYGPMPRYCANSSLITGTVPALVGFSPGFHAGHAAFDPQSRDLSVDSEFTTGNDTAANIGLTCLTGSASDNEAYGGRLIAGVNARWRADNLPAGTLVGVQLLSLGGSQPGLQLPGITAPGVLLSTSLDVVLWEVHLLPGASVTTSGSLPIPAGVEGAELHSQYVVLNGLFDGGSLITSASNALRQTVGRR